MNDVEATLPRRVRADDDALTWRGVIEVEHTPDWSRGWRLPFSRLELFPGDGLRARAAAQAGVRIEFGTDTIGVAGRAVSDQVDDTGQVDLVIDGTLIQSATVGTDGTFAFGPIPPGEKTAELWFPQRGDFRLAEVRIDGDARLWPATTAARPRLVTYGSSITQCTAAASPARTWPALVARQLGADLTCLGFGGQCHLDPMIARMIRNLPADLITACLGINVYGKGTYTERSFLPTVLGFISTIRDGHPETPILVISPILAPNREHTPGAGGMTLTQLRADVREGVRLLRDHGAQNVHLLDGLDVFGPQQGRMLHDGLHPDAEGYAHMAASITPMIRKLLE